MLSESSTQTVARRSANAPFLRYLGWKGTQIRNAFLRGGTPRMLTRSVLPCVGRGLSYGTMKAGMRGRLAFCTFPDARESRICDGGGGRARISEPRGGGIVILTLGILLFIPTIFACLFCFDAVYRIVLCRLAALGVDGGQGDGADGQQSQCKNPPVQGCLVGEVFQITVHAIPSQGRSHDKTERQREAVLPEKHPDDAVRGGSHDFTQPDFLPSVVAFKKRHAEHAGQRNGGGQKAEEDKGLLRVFLFRVDVFHKLELGFQLECAFRREIQAEVHDGLEGVFQSHAFPDADVGHAL